MTRDELVDAGAAALVRDGLDALFSTSAQVMSARVIDSVENLIRADERAKARSLVAGLPVERRSPRGVALVERVRVLDLIDGGSDE